MESMFKALQNAFGFNKKINKITLGICAMDKKANSKPMQELLKRLPENLFEVVPFSDDMILSQPIESWPVVDALIAFYSKGYPTMKAMEYIKLRKPYCINDLEMEHVLADRRLVYTRLQECGVNVPNYVVLNRDDPTLVNQVEEYDEYVIINGKQLNKPLVEKPVDAEDHNIYIYYPSSAGGGSKRLFRKVDNKSSMFHPTVNELRKEGSYIYEEFLSTSGVDVKVYTVGPDYAHAEARKSPVLDGKVNRDHSGFESRYPVILNEKEKDFARKIVEGFRQTVCGFDILRVKKEDKSYVCDVNGFSFVKNSKKYYDDASQVLVELLLTRLRPKHYSVPSTRAPLIRNSMKGPSRSGSGSNSNESSRSPSPLVEVDKDDRTPNSSTSERSQRASSREGGGSGDKSGDEQPEELRCVIAVIRHGDRTPKQKMKIKCSIPKYLDYFHRYIYKYNNNTNKPEKDLKVKQRSCLIEFLETTREIISENSVKNTLDENLFRKLKQMRDVLERWEISGINRKLQMKPQMWERDENGKAIRATEVLLILKWGGDLTPLGMEQAESLGRQFRHQMYPDHSGGVLRLHSTYRHDLKIKASDEGRVMKTAAAFAKGLLELEGQLTPIIVSLVDWEEKNRQLLDRNGNFAVAEDIERSKAHLNLLQNTTVMTSDRADEIAPGGPASVKRAMMKLTNPRQSLTDIHGLIAQLCQILSEFIENVQPTHNLNSLLKNQNSLTSADIIPGGIGESPGSLDGSSSKGADTPSLTPLGRSRESSNANLIGSFNSVEFPVQTQQQQIPTPTAGASSPNANGDSEVLNLRDPQTFSSIAAEKRYSHSYPTMTKSPSSDSLLSLADGLYLSETYELMHGRWEKLYKDFYNKETDQFDLSKVPDVYDMIRYDCLHNSHLNLKVMEDLYHLSATMENIIVPQEYGVDKEDKLRIGSKMCGELLKKIKSDLEHSHSDLRVDDNHYTLDNSYAEHVGIKTLGRHVRTRLYFTSESHIHTLLNELRYCDWEAERTKYAISPEGMERLDNIPELGYLTQVVFRLYEDRIDPSKFRCEIVLSPGAINNPWTGSKTAIAPNVTLNKSIDYDDLLAYLDSAIAAGEKLAPMPTLERTYSDSSVSSVRAASDGGTSSKLSKGKNKTTVVTSLIDTGASWELPYQSQRKDRAQSLDKVNKKDKKKKEKWSSAGSKDDGSTNKSSSTEDISDNVNALLLAPHLVIDETKSTDGLNGQSPGSPGNGGGKVSTKSFPASDDKPIVIEE